MLRKSLTYKKEHKRTNWLNFTERGAIKCLYSKYRVKYWKVAWRITFAQN